MSKPDQPDLHFQGPRHGLEDLHARGSCPRRLLPTRVASPQRDQKAMNAPEPLVIGKVLAMKSSRFMSFENYESANAHARCASQLAIATTK